MRAMTQEKALAEGVRGRGTRASDWFPPSPPGRRPRGPPPRTRCTEGNTEAGRWRECEMAMTNLCPGATRSASELGRDELEDGRRVLDRKIVGLGPEPVVFVDLTLYRAFFGKSRIGAPGPGPKPDRIHGSRVFVLPNPSGLNASFPGFADKLRWFKRLGTSLSDVAKG